MPKLSQTVISDFTAQSARPKARRYEIRDAELRGFMLRVNPGGTKSWYVQLDRNHKRKIGDARVLTATRARYRARDLLERAESLKSAASGPGLPSLGGFLIGRYGDWLERRIHELYNPPRETESDDPTSQRPGASPGTP